MHETVIHISEGLAAEPTNIRPSWKRVARESAGRSARKAELWQSRHGCTDVEEEDGKLGIIKGKVKECEEGQMRV